MRLFWNMRRGLVAFVATAAFLVISSPPARAAGGLEDSWWLAAIPCLTVATPLALVGWAFANRGPKQLSLLMLAGWLTAWLWLWFEKGLSGAVERAGVFSGSMAAVSVVVLLGWVIGRILRVPDEPAASVSNGHS